MAAFPTETLYGIGGMHASESAAARVRAMKRLERHAPLLLLVPDIDWVLRLSGPAARQPAAREIMSHFWPGPLTLILPASAGAPHWIAPAGASIAMRLPGPSAAAELVRVLGAPLVATSANRHGEPPAMDGAAVCRTFGAELDLVLDGGPIPGDNPSTLVDLTGPRARILREGAIPAGDLIPWTG